MYSKYDILFLSSTNNIPDAMGWNQHGTGINISTEYSGWRRKTKNRQSICYARKRNPIET
jgi:hypothetical protein